MVSTTEWPTGKRPNWENKGNEEGSDGGDEGESDLKSVADRCVLVGKSYKHS